MTTATRTHGLLASEARKAASTPVTYGFLAAILAFTALNMSLSLSDKTAGLDTAAGIRHVFSAGRGGHFRFCDGCAFEPVDPLLDLHPDHLRHLVCFHVRAEGLHATGDSDHPADVFPNPIGVNQHRRRSDVGPVGNVKPIAHAISNTASISTVMSPGNETMPIALRAPTPFSLPNTSANSSLQPLMTLG